MKKTAEEILDENVSFRDEVKKEFVLRSMEEYASQIRPKWIKIESEEDLPKEVNGVYWVVKKGFTSPTVELKKVYGALEKWQKKIWIETYTHYMPIIKPEPPKED